MSEDGSGLLEAARRGDEAAFLALYRRYRTPLFRFVWRLTRSEQAAEDVIQECFLVLMQRASLFRAAQGSLRGYLFGIARHLALKRTRIAGRESEEVERVEEDLGPLEGVLEAERSEAVAEAIEALSPQQREVVILFEYEELSLDEIAQVVGIEPGAVKARLHRGREVLRRRLAPLIETRAERRGM